MVVEPGDSADCVSPPPKVAKPPESRELGTWPAAMRMPRIASGSLAEASPEEMICCTRLAFWFRSDCSSAYTLKAVMVCGSCTPVLCSPVCATWIRRTSSSTWLRPSSRLWSVVLKASSVRSGARKVMARLLWETAACATAKIFFAMESTSFSSSSLNPLRYTVSVFWGRNLLRFEGVF